jgi:hypothetical protein
MSLQIQGPEWFEDVAITVPITPQEYVTQKELRKNKWIWGVLVEAQFHIRAATGAATPLTYNKEFPLGFIDRWRVEGNRIGFGVREFLNASGPTFWQFVNFFSLRPQSALVSFNAGAAFQAIGGPFPIGSPGTVTLPTIVSSTNNDYDVQVAYLLPFVPLGISVDQQALFMIKGDEWETLNFHFAVADSSGLFDNPTGTTFTFGAFGSGVGAVAGTPLVRVHLLRPNLGLARNKFSPALVWRTFQQSSFNVTLQGSSLTDGLLARLSVTPNKYLRLIWKTGIKPTSTPTAGVNAVIQGLSDKIITRPKIKVSGKLVRNPIDTFSQKEWYMDTHGAVMPPGYSMYDFCELGDINTFFPTKGLTKDDFTFEGDLIGAANQIGELLEERIEGEPSQAGT